MTLSIDHIIMTELAQAGIFGAAEEPISGGNRPVVADFVFCEDLEANPSFLPVRASRTCLPFRDRQAQTGLVKYVPQNPLVFRK